MKARHTREMKCAKQLMGGFTNKGTLELTPSYERKYEYNQKVVMD